MLHRDEEFALKVKKFQKPREEAMDSVLVNDVVL
jgi:hypothetical protein